MYNFGRLDSGGIARQADGVMPPPAADETPDEYRSQRYRDLEVNWCCGPLDDEPEYVGRLRFREFTLIDRLILTVAATLLIFGVVSSRGGGDHAEPRPAVRAVAPDVPDRCDHHAFGREDDDC